MKKKIISIFLSICLIIGMMPATVIQAFAADDYGITVGGVQLSSEQQGVETGDGAVTAGSAFYDAAAATLTITDLNVDMTGHNGAAISVDAGTHITIVLAGENELTGSPGFAGIAVAPGWDPDGNLSEEEAAKIIITGDGALVANGGSGSSDTGAGAGIGGNGYGDVDGHRDAGDFGYIVINNGNITANGGEAYYHAPWSCYLHGAAGIGGGGVTEGWLYAGDISIFGGTVAANGSEGGAGIGSGAADGSDTYSDALNITIGAGTVTARGGYLSAGIGSGDTGSAGTIKITGGNITAIAGSGDDPLGAAGIGGGSNGSVKSISISGGAHVAATASGGAAGIGGGANTSYGIQWGDTGGTVSEERLGKISICGAGTEVFAYGGTSTGYSGTYGGAGIGSGYPVSNNSRSVAFQISITDGCFVQAYGGYHANAIGYGYRPTDLTGYGITLIMDDTISLFAQNDDYYQPALVSATANDNGRTPVTYASSSSHMVHYVDENRDALLAGSSNAPGYLSLPSASADKIFDWSFDSQSMTVSAGPATINVERALHGNWAALIRQSIYTVTFDSRGGTDVEAQKVADGSAAVRPEDPTRSSYTFEGWYTDAACTTEYDFDASVTEDITLYAKWTLASQLFPLRYESNGGTGFDTEYYSSGTTAELTRVPTREGYTFTGWYADAALTQPVTSVLMDSSKTVYAGWKVSTVPDMLNGDDHFAYIVGYADETVRPDENITRAEAATIFFRLLKDEIRDSCLTADNPFDDVNAGSWYNTAVSTMAALGIINGRTDSTFEPNAPISRAELAAICARFDTTVSGAGSNFTDIAGHWAEEEIMRAVTLGWIDGYPDDTFRPDQPITRAEAMTLINRVLQRLPETEQDLLDGMTVWPDNSAYDWYYLAVQEATNSHEYRHKGQIYEYWIRLTADPDWERYE